MRDLRFRRAGMMVLVSALIVSLLLSVVFAGTDPVWPQSGKKVRTDGNLTVDESNSADGYVIVHSKKVKKKLKLRVSYGDTTLDYDLNKDGANEVIPLQLGSGTYTFTLYRNTEGKKYTQDGRVRVTAKLTSEFAAALCPSQQIWYTSETEAVKKSFSLCEELETDEEKFKAISAYVSKNLMYDYIKALTVQSGTLPDIDGCWQTKMGICQDLAAVTVCMLRVQGIPARMMVGKADTTYHAWVTAFVDGEWQFFDPTVAITQSKFKKYTAEKYY